MKRRFHVVSVGFVALALPAACGGGVERSTGSSGSGAMAANAGASGAGGNAGTGGSTGGSAGNCNLSCELERTQGGQAYCECRRAPPECSSDVDCALAINVATCCFGCAGSYPRTLVEREPCLVLPGRLVPTACTPECDDVACPAIDCAPPARAICQAGRCLGTQECLPDQVLGPNR